jgi:hypothetical protein
VKRADGGRSLKVDDGFDDTAIGLLFGLYKCFSVISLECKYCLMITINHYLEQVVFWVGKQLTFAG